MDFQSLPPEVTSALIHSGPGPASLIEASGAWQDLGAGLEETVPTYASVVSSLTQAWQGPSSVAMTQAVQPFLTWLRTTAQQCQQLASSAQAAAAAFNSAQSAVVQPSVVAANRTRLAQLIATDRLGGNLAAIAETEAQYQTMWVNNSAAMNTYQTASTQALQLTQFSSPPAIASPTAAATQASAVPTAAASTSAAPTLGSIFDIFAPGTNASATGLSGLLNVISGSAGSSFGSLFNSNIFTTGIVNSTFSSGFPINLLSYIAQTTAAQALQSVSGDVGTGLSEGEAALGPDLGSLGLGVAGIGAPAATMGVGVSLGNLTAPPAVVGLLPAAQAPVQLASAASPLDGADAGFPMLPPLMPPPISAGSGWRKRKQPKFEDLHVGAEVKGSVMRPPPSAG